VVASPWPAHRARHRALSAALPISAPVVALLAGATGFGLCIVGRGSPGWWSAPVVAAVVLLATKVRPT